MLEPADLNAAATPAAPLDEPIEIALVDRAARARCASRVRRSQARLDAALVRAVGARGSFLQAVRDAIGWRSIAGGTTAGAARAASPAEAAPACAAERSWRRDRRLRGACRAPPVHDRGSDRESRRARTRTLTARSRHACAAKSNALLAALAAHARRSARNASSGARAARRAAGRGAAGALDGEALPILPPFARVAGDDAAARMPPQSVDALVAPWRRCGRAVALARRRRRRTCAGVTAHSRSAPRRPETTPIADRTRIAADETEAPRSRAFRHLPGARATTVAAPSYAGFVCDEWAEQRPSRTQLAAMAVNYDSPQSEPPQCLLLVRAARSGRWTRGRTTRPREMVAEAIALDEDPRAVDRRQAVAGVAAAARQSGSPSRAPTRAHSEAACSGASPTSGSPASRASSSSPKPSRPTGLGARESRHQRAHRLPPSQGVSHAERHRTDPAAPRRSTSASTSARRWRRGSRTRCGSSPASGRAASSRRRTAAASR